MTQNTILTKLYSKINKSKTTEVKKAGLLYMLFTCVRTYSQMPILTTLLSDNAWSTRFFFHILIFCIIDVSAALLVCNETSFPMVMTSPTFVFQKLLVSAVIFFAPSVTGRVKKFTTLLDAFERSWQVIGNLS